MVETSAFFVIATWILLFLIHFIHASSIASFESMIYKQNFRFQHRNVVYSLPYEFYSPDKLLLRSKRNTDCHYRCGSGECLRYQQICDGVVDCEDSSDETRGQCGRQSCASSLYKCKYGACIPLKKMCDGVTDCADNSDEDIPQCVKTKQANRCAEGIEFRCRNGACINVKAVCDGVEACSDGSDETEEVCSNKLCSSNLYRCSYGACVNKDARCNGVKECADGSDELDCPLPSISGSVLSEMKGSTECPLPYHPDHGLYQLAFEDTDGAYVFNGGKMEITCDEDYILRGAPRFTCSSGTWTPPVNESYCTRECSTLAPTSTYNVVCILKNVYIECVTPPDGTVAQVRCKPDYTYDFADNRILKCDNGIWSEKPQPCKEINYDIECALPTDLPNGRFVSNDSKLVVELGTSIPHLNTVQMVCDDGYSPIQSLYFKCITGQWNPDIDRGRCLRECPAMMPTSTYNVACTLNGISVDCEKPVEGTVTEILCKPNYTSSDKNIVILICKNGAWSGVPKPCLPIHYQRGCTLPPALANGHYVALTGDIVLKMGAYVQHFSALKLSCDPGHVPTKYTHFICLEGQWRPDINKGRCLRTCPPLPSSHTYTVRCEYNSHSVSCDNPITNTTAKVMCAQFYVSPIHVNPILLCENGNWDLKPTPCEPECGQKIVNSATLVIGGGDTIPGEYPWIATIYYDKDNKGYTHVCAGSIISRFYVLSAAHCFVDKQGIVREKELYAIVAGKYFRDFNIKEDKTQIKKIKELYVHEDYRGLLKWHSDDIALIVVDTKFELSEKVEPVCVDWNNLYDGIDLQYNNKGVVAGWGLTKEGAQPSETLMKLVLPYIPMSVCARKLDPTFFRRYADSKKFCAGFHDKSKSVCNGDSGGGLYFQSADGAYYIRGIVSISPRSGNSCNSNRYALYTRVSKYLEWMEEKTRRVL